MQSEFVFPRGYASDLRMEGDLAPQRALRFAIYHLQSAAKPQDDHLSIGSGSAYKGHIFWDTDIFMLPFFDSNRFLNRPRCRAGPGCLGALICIIAFLLQSMEVRHRV